jgi:hypothetical protein
MFWAFGLILALTVVPFLIAKLVLRKTAWELAGPYLTFAVPQLIFVPVALGLRTWEKRRPSPKLLALCWSLSMAFLVAAIDGAFFFSGIALHLIDLKDAVDVFVFVLAASVLSVSFIAYRQVLPVIAAGADHR